MIKIKISIIDLDNIDKKTKFPNLALMKISAYHKSIGDSVVWGNPMFSEKTYISKVFKETKDYPYCVENASFGGVGFGDLDSNLPKEIEDMFPDYSIYPEFKDNAYGFLTRGCPRNCDFCNVSKTQGNSSKKVADLKNFWNGQKNIVLLDPNILASKDWKELFQQLIDSKAFIDFTQGLDVRLLTDEKIEMLNKIKIKMLHFAWDSVDNLTYEKLKEVRGKLKFDGRKLGVYVLTNFNTTLEQDLERVEKLMELDYSPYIMIYNKKYLKKGSKIKKLQRLVNNRFIFRSFKSFEELNDALN